MKTEAEAKECLCCGPFGVLPPKLSPLSLGGHESPSFGTCVGSRCMAWRWQDLDEPLRHTPEYRPYQQEHEPPRPKEVPDNWIWVPASQAAKANRPSHWIEPIPERHGYCGLAGKAE